MKPEQVSESKDKQSPNKAKKTKSNALLTGLAIGIMIGIVIYSVINNSLVLLTLIPLYFIYRLVKKPGEKQVILNQGSGSFVVTME